MIQKLSLTWTYPTEQQQQLEEFNKGQKKDTACSTASQSPSRWRPSTTRKDPASEWLAKENPENNPIIIKLETESYVAEWSSWVPLPCCSPPGRLFPVKCLSLSACVSSGTIHCWELDQSPLSGPWKGSPFLQQLEHLSPGWASVCYCKCAQFKSIEGAGIIWSLTCA